MKTNNCVKRDVVLFLLSYKTTYYLIFPNFIFLFGLFTF